MSSDAQMMDAYQLVTPGCAPQWRRVPVPVPTSDGVVLEVSAAGLCHSDLTIMAIGPEQFHLPLPLTLGHECAGRVVAVGENVTSIRIGDSVAVAGAWGCGKCRACSRGAENYCPSGGTLYRPGKDLIRPPGGGAPGALADFISVPHERHLVDIEDLNPSIAAPLTDAGVTAYHAIARILPTLQSESVVLVIGVGGLGHLALQVLRASTSATVVALDSDRALAGSSITWGADYFTSDDDDVAELINVLTKGDGATSIIDFVASPTTVDLTLRVAGPASSVVLVGLGGGRIPMSFETVPAGLSVSVTRWGSRSDLAAVIDLARRGVLIPEITTFPPREVDAAYRALRSGQVTGRAVVVRSSQTE